ncbi:hypothetical protein K438DRAFT_1822066 [Mycena galopus ATCC 62051]|nr:hypothetical protein K438DRAFT_1822066 [Mycena galopus ATCC 62051]
MVSGHPDQGRCASSFKSIIKQLLIVLLLLHCLRTLNYGTPRFKLTSSQDSVAKLVTLLSRLTKQHYLFIKCLPDCLGWGIKTTELSDEHTNQLNSIKLKRKSEADF